MELFFKNCDNRLRKPEAILGDVDLLSRQINADIPQELVNFWLNTEDCLFCAKNNTAHPTVKIEDLEDTFFSSGFLCFTVLPLSGCSDVAGVIHTGCLSKDKSLLLKFISDMGGNYIAINLSRNDTGGIYYYDHETEEAFLAHQSIRDLICSLTEDPSWTPEDIQHELLSESTICWKV